MTISSRSPDIFILGIDIFLILSWLWAMICPGQICSVGLRPSTIVGTELWLCNEGPGSMGLSFSLTR